MREVGGPAALDMEFEFLQVLPMHECKHLIGEACNLLNSEWPRSKTARFQSLFMSCEKFPTSLVLILNDFQVVGHVKLSEIFVKGPDIMVESVIISKEHRGKGWGKMLMEDAEEYVRRRGKKMLYLSTRGQEGFYEKLGYEVCKPILYYGVALEPTSDGEIKVNGHLPNKNVPAVNGVPVETRACIRNSVENGEAVPNGVKNGEAVQNGVENSESVQNGVENAEAVQNGAVVQNGVVYSESVPNENPVANGVPQCLIRSNGPVICPVSPPPPPPPLPSNNNKSRTIFRDIKSSKTYMGKSVKTSCHVNFLCKDS